MKIPSTPEGRRQYLIHGTLVWAAVCFVGIVGSFYTWNNVNVELREFALFLAGVGAVAVVIGLVTLRRIQ